MIPRELSNLGCIVARFDSRGGVEISGCAGDLDHLATVLASGNADGVVLGLTVPDASAAPYDGFIRSLTISDTVQGVRVTRIGDTMLVSGSRSSILLLSQSIVFVARSGNRRESPILSHTHIEYYVGHPFLEPESEPLIVTLRTHCL